MLFSSHTQPKWIVLHLAISRPALTKHNVQFYFHICQHHVILVMTQINSVPQRQQINVQFYIFTNTCYNTFDFVIYDLETYWSHVLYIERMIYRLSRLLQWHASRSLRNYMVSVTHFRLRDIGIHVVTLLTLALIALIV